jgi:hypothetical protein
LKSELTSKALEIQSGLWHLVDMPATFEEIERLHQWVKNHTSIVNKFVDGMFDSGSPFFIPDLTEADIAKFDAYKVALKEIKQNHNTKTNDLALIMPLNSSQEYDTRLGKLRYDLDELGKKVTNAFEISIHPNEYAEYRRTRDGWEANLGQPDALDTVIETLSTQENRLRDASHSQLKTLRDMVNTLAQRVRSARERCNLAAEASEQARFEQSTGGAVAQAFSSHASSSSSPPAADHYQLLTRRRNSEDQDRHQDHSFTHGGMRI